MRSQKSLTTKHLLLIVRLLGCIENDNVYGAYPHAQRLTRNYRKQGTDAADILLVRQDICDEVYGASPLPQRLARKYRRRGTDAAGVLLLRQGIRDNAYGALSAAFPTMHILEDKI